MIIIQRTASDLASFSASGVIWESFSRKPSADSSTLRITQLSNFDYELSKVSIKSSLVIVLLLILIDEL